MADRLSASLLKPVPVRKALDHESEAMNLSHDTRMSLTMGLMILLAGACSASQLHTLHDVAEGIHATCESSDPAMHLLLSKTEADAGPQDAAGRD